jgi:hypothetical protein
MKSRVLHSSYVTNFFDVDFQSDKISEILKFQTDKALEGFKNDVLKDWEIHFVFIYNNVKSILVYNKAQSYPNEKYKEITIHIPIPTEYVVSWGVKQGQHIYEINHLDKIIKNFISMDVDFYKYNNRHDYILDCMQRAIKLSLKEGFMMSGIRVKVK